VFAGPATEEVTLADPRVTATVEVLNPWATMVVSEIRNSLDYYQASNPGAPIQSLTLAGRTAELDGLMERIATQIPLPVRTMDPLVGLSASRSVAKSGVPDARLAVAAGLAMGVPA
jgi:Tfp pilus assembly PilM family ATPase